MLVLSDEQRCAYDAERAEAARGTLCHAPFKTLRFNPGGKVVPCSQNSILELGRYPEQSIREIWEGAPMAALRRQLGAYRLAVGCHECQQAFDEGFFGSVRALMYDPLTVHPSHPTLLDFKLDNVCNLACIMCTSYSSSRIQRTPNGSPLREAVYDQRFVDQLGEFLPHIEEARFTGGEPFLMDVYFRIWERIAEINPACRIDIQTNGVVLNDRVRCLLERLHVRLHVSLDSLDPARFESIRVGARYEPMRENLEYFLRYSRDRGTVLTVNTCAMRETRQELPEMVHFCNRIGVRIAFCFVWFPAEQAIWTLPAAVIADIVEHYERVELPDGTEVERRNAQRFRELTTTVKACHQAALARERGGHPVAVPLPRGQMIEALVAGCRAVAADEAQARQVVARLRARLAPAFEEPELQQRFAAYLTCFLGMFSADILVDTLLHEPVDKIRRDVEAFQLTDAALAAGPPVPPLGTGGTGS